MTLEGLSEGIFNFDVENRSVGDYGESYVSETLEEKCFEFLRLLNIHQ